MKKRTMQMITAVVFALTGALLLSVITTGCSTNNTSSAGVDLVNSPNIPENIKTPDSMQTETLGELTFKDGMPTKETVELVRDDLFLTRAKTTFLDGIPVASIAAMWQGYRSIGVELGDFGMNTTGFLDSSSLWLTPNTSVMYAFAPVIVEDNEPLVVEVPSGVLGLVNNAKFDYEADLGMVGADKGKGGKYLLVSDDYTGKVPEGYFVVTMHTRAAMVFIRGFVDPAVGFDASSKRIQDGLSIYKLSEAANPPKENFTDITGLKYNTVHANDADFYKELSDVVDREDAGALGDSLTGDLQAIGIEKGKPFNPTRHEQELLEEAATIGNATARALAYASADRTVYKYDDINSQWYFPFSHKNYDFKVNGTLYKADRTQFFYAQTGVTPAMVNKGGKMIGKGSDYVNAARDSDGEYLMGDNTYSITLPADVPAARFWSFMVYSGQTRSILATGMLKGGMDSLGKVNKNADGSTTIIFSAERPDNAKNWVQTVEGKSFNVMFRMYGPLENWFNESWKVGEFKKVK